MDLSSESVWISLSKLMVSPSKRSNPEIEYSSLGMLLSWEDGFICMQLIYGFIVLAFLISCRNCLSFCSLFFSTCSFSFWRRKIWVWSLVFQWMAIFFVSFQRFIQFLIASNSSARVQYLFLASLATKLSLCSSVSISAFMTCSSLIRVYFMLRLRVEFSFLRVVISSRNYLTICRMVFVLLSSSGLGRERIRDFLLRFLRDIDLRTVYLYPWSYPLISLDLSCASISRMRVLALVFASVSYFICERRVRFSEQRCSWSQKKDFFLKNEALSFLSVRQESRARRDWADSRGCLFGRIYWCDDKLIIQQNNQQEQLKLMNLMKQKQKMENQTTLFLRMMKLISFIFVDQRFYLLIKTNDSYKIWPRYLFYRSENLSFWALWIWLISMIIFERYLVGFVYITYLFDLMKKATLSLLAKHLNPASQVVMRADFNVPIKDGKVTDVNRIKSTVPTIHELLKHNPKSLVLLSHLGRPNGQKNAKHSLKPVLSHLEQHLGRPVTFLDDCVGEGVIDQVNKSQGQVFLCENVRFHPEEEGSIKDKDGKKIKSKPEAIQSFRKQLSRLGNVYVNDAFGSAHRAHSSVVGINHKFRVAGLLMQKELEYLGGFLQQPRKPVLVILGGSKVTDKIELILNMLNIADEIIIGGGMSNPFLRQFYGHKLGITQVDMPSDPNTLQQIMDKANAKGVKIHLPVDGVCAQAYSPTAPTIICDNKDVPEGWEIFDKGPKTVEQFDKVVQRANSIFWNGPIGVFEFPNFKNGSEGLLQSVIKRTSAGATSIIGGGDTASLVLSRGAEKKVSYVSTGGGASLEFMQGLKLPGVQALSEVADLN